MKIGPKSQAQLRDIALSWNQGDHVLVTGGTGSGKTLLARQLDEIRIQRGGNVVVFVCKLQPDETITKYYRGFKRWTAWKKRPLLTENKILLWPKVEGLSAVDAMALMKKVFSEALDEISKTGRWTVHIDEGLMISHPQYLGLGHVLGMMHVLIRSAKGTMLTLAQRPAHLPVTIYPNLSHAFIGRASELPDLKRLADMDGMTSSRELQRMISENGKHDFIWVPIGQDRPPERMNLRL